MKLHEFYTAGHGTAMLIGNPLSSAINAPRGQKLNAYKDATGNVVGDQQVGAALGAGSGALLGGAAGAAAGPLLTKSVFTPKEFRNFLRNGGTRSKKMAMMRGAGAVVGGLAGLAGGAVAGGALGGLHGHYGKRAEEIRKRHLSANLKPVLRELAAISEGLKEFAMVRDESGRYVEVPEQGGGNTALKVGAGVAGLAAVGGAYKGHQAVMNKFSPVGPRQAGFNGVKEAYGNAGKAAWNATSGTASGAVGAAKGGLRGGLLKIARALKPARI